VRCVLLYNPAAGRKLEQRGDEIERAAARLRGLGHEATTVPTKGPGFAGNQAREAVQDGAEVVFACGGDGTVHEALQGLVALDASPGAALGIVPLGSTNALARHLRIAPDVERAVEQQIAGERTAISVGSLEVGEQVRHFAVMAGAGPDGTLARELQGESKPQPGWVAYALHAARIFLTRRMPRFAVEYTGLDGGKERWEVVSAMAARVDSLTGIFSGLVERGAPDDRESLRLALLRPPGLISLPLWFLTGWLGMRRLNPFLVEARALEFECQPLEQAVVQCEADGEWLGPIPMRVSVAPSAVTVLLPRDRA
jgi:diacylglycerol kinase (ATP)